MLPLYSTLSDAEAVQTARFLSATENSEIPVEAPKSILRFDTFVKKVKCESHIGIGFTWD